MNNKHKLKLSRDIKVKIPKVTEIIEFICPNAEEIFTNFSENSYYDDKDKESIELAMFSQSIWREYVDEMHKRFIAGGHSTHEWYRKQAKDEKLRGAISGRYHWKKCIIPCFGYISKEGRRLKAEGHEDSMETAGSALWQKFRCKACEKEFKKIKNSDLRKILWLYNLGDNKDE